MTTILAHLKASYVPSFLYFYNPTISFKVLLEHATRVQNPYRAKLTCQLSLSLD